MLDADTIIHNLDKVAVSKNSLEPLCHLAGLTQNLFCASTLIFQDRLIEFAGNATAKTNDPFVMLLQQLAINSRLEIESFQRCLGCHLYQVLKTGSILAKQRQMVTLLLGSTTFFQAALGRDIGFVPDDGIDAFFTSGLVELQRPVQIPVIGNRQRIHSVILGSLHQARDRTGTVQ